MKLIFVGSALFLMFLLLAFFGIRHYKVSELESSLESIPRLSLSRNLTVYSFVYSVPVPSKKKMSWQIESAFSSLSREWNTRQSLIWKHPKQTCRRLLVEWIFKSNLFLTQISFPAKPKIDPNMTKSIMYHNLLKSVYHFDKNKCIKISH